MIVRHSIASEGLVCMSAGGGVERDAIGGGGIFGNGFDDVGGGIVCDDDDVGGGGLGTVPLSAILPVLLLLPLFTTKSCLSGVSTPPLLSTINTPTTHLPPLPLVCS